MEATPKASINRFGCASFTQGRTSREQIGGPHEAAYRFQREEKGPDGHGIEAQVIPNALRKKGNGKDTKNGLRSVLRARRSADKAT
jgi:hypothetical protein